MIRVKPFNVTVVHHDHSQTSAMPVGAKNIGGLHFYGVKRVSAICVDDECPFVCVGQCKHFHLIVRCSGVTNLLVIVGKHRPGVHSIATNPRLVGVVGLKKGIHEDVFASGCFASVLQAQSVSG